MALVCKMTACCPARRRQLTLQIFGFHSVKLLFIALLVSGYPLPTAEAADRDKGEIILESARIPAQERAAKLKKPDGTESKIAADLDPSLRKLGKTSQDANYYLVRVKGPKVAHVKEQLVMAGGEVIDYTQHYTFVVKMNAPAMEKVQNLDEIEWIGVYKAEHRIAKRLKTKVADIRGKKEKEPEGGLVLDIYLFSVGAMDGIADIVRKNGGEVKAEARNEELPKLRVQVPSGIIDTLSTLSEIKMMHEYIPEVLLNDQATGIMGVQPVWDTHGLTGTNQIIGHADSGLDTGDLRTINADFAGRIVAAFALGRSNNNDWSDFGGHGTHTAGSILGNGSNSAGQYRGVAHEARLVHQSVGDAAGGLGGIPLDFGTLFTQAYTNGARIHSDSWGGGRVGSYGPATYVDQWSWNNGSPRDALVVFAAGNSGPSSNTIDYPGTAKNCLTVGASENNRSTCGNDGDNVSAVASSSSRGPTDEGRIKPDLVAPGTWIASIRTHGDRTVFIDDCEDGPNGWSEEWISGTAATPWTLSTNAGARSGSCSWHYTATGPFQDYLVSPQVHIPADGRAYLFRTKIWKNSVTGTWFPGVGWRTNGGTWVNSSVFYNPTGTNFNDWLTLYSSVPGSFTGKTVQVSLRAYAPGDANSVDVYVDDLAVGTYKTLDDMWGRGLAVMGNGIDTNYALDGGTSMATPLTAGAAALVRQFYQERRGHSTPSAALIKATLINGAAEMTPATPRPNNNEGWGRLNLEYSLFPPAPRAVVFFDQAAGLGEGEQQTYSVDVTDSSEQLRATLVWSDRQGATLQNDLDMTLVRPDSTSTNRSDGANNVEGIDIASPARGNWSVIVEGKTVPYGPQPYALVLSGGLSAAGPTNRTQHRLIYTQGFNSLALPEDWGTQVVNQVGAIKPIISCVTTSASYPSGLPAYEGSYFLEFNSHSCSNNSQARVRQVGAMSSAGFTNIMVEFAWARDSGYSYRNDFVESQWSTNGVTWESVATHYRYSSLGTAWHKVSTALPPGTCNRTNLYLSFLFTSRLGHNCHLDGLRVTGEPLSYRVNFDAAGGTDASPTSIVVTYLAPYGELATTSRAGHTFGGWWTSPDGGGTQVTGESVMTVAADQTLYAKWTANTYVVSFDADGGTDPDPPTVTVTHGATYGALPASARPGYTFGGWWTSPNGEGTQVIPTTQVTITSDQSLYAKWTASSYTVSFDAQGGSTPSPTSTTVTYGGTYGPLATTIRGGYTFGGWWTGPGGTGVQVSAATSVTITANQTLYAKWTANTYTVSFDSQGGSTPSPTTITVTYGSTYGPLATTIRGGYTFGGWWTGPGGTGVQVSAATSVTITANQTLYAKWTANTYTVSFDSQGGSTPSPTTTTVTYGGTYGPLATTTRSGYAFAGWWTGPGGTGAEVTPTTPVTITAGQTLYAKWTANTYTVSFDAQGGSTPSPTSTTVTYGGTYGPLATTMRAGYGFSGWWTGPGGTGAEVTPTAPVAITANQTLYAKWTVNTYTVSFDSQGGSTPSPTTTTVTYGGTYGPLATTTRSGYTFAGWWTGPGGTGAEVISTTQVAITVDQTLYAKWTANTYTVSFDSQGGSTPSPTTITVTYGSTYGPLATTTRSGYTFAGWWTGPGGTGAEVTPTTPVTITADQALYAKWTANTYTVSFDSQGGSTPSPTAITVTHGSTYGLLATTTRAGYGFSGWWTGPGGTGEEVTSTTPVTITASQTLYAKWTVNTYTVSFDAQGGTAPSPATVSVTSGSTYGLLASTARVGYTFAGWWTGPGGTGAEVTPTTPVTITADQTLYAKWTANTYTVSFNAQGGTAPSPATTTVTYGGTYGPLATTIRTGYAFGGWWTGPGGTGAEVISTTQVAITANQTLYAKWTVNTYTVSFDAQGGSTPSPATTTVTYGGTYGALATTTRTGYAFNGWWTSPGGTGAEVTSTSQVTITTNQTLYAKWTASTYTVSFDSQGGSTPSPTTTTVTYEGTYGSLATTMRAGYTFGGWWTGPGGTGAEVISTTQVAITANQTLYAKWTVNTYTVSFDAQGGSTPSPATTTVTYGGTYGALATTTRAGYGFAGWWTGPGGTGAEVTPTTPVTITADQTLYAKWTANTYTVSFDAQGGTAPSPTTVNVTSGSTYGPLATTTREGYTFAGWWTGPGGVGVQVTAAMSVTITDNQTLYAKWTATTYTVGFDAQGGTAPSPAATTVIYGAAYGPLASTTRPGYTFGGWWTSPGGAGDEVMSSTLVSITDDQTLYAKWTANTYTVTFDAQGGADPSPETTEVTYGATYGPLATTTRTGYIFAGWWTLPDGEGQEVTPLTPVMIADNQTLYAKWTQDSLRVIPDDGLTTAGSTGGPFVPPGKQYTLVNEGSSSLTWNAACPSNWVYVAPSTGTLPAGGTNLVTVSISSNTLGAGVHDAAVTFSNVTAGIISAARPVNLTVSASGEGVLTTTFAGGNGYAGNMFDIIPKANLEITALDVNISPTGAVTTVSVYYRQGSSFGFENSSAGWTLLATQNVSSAGEDMPTHVNLTGNDRVLAVGETYGFYVYINYGSGIEMHYSNGSNTYENADLTLISNCGKGSPPFVGGTYSPRTWNGTIYYDTRVGRHLNVVLPEEVTEGDGVLAGQGSVIITPAPGTNLAVSLTSSDTGEALVPTSVMVPAGQTNVVFDITVVDDGELDGTQMATINASAAGYIDGSATVAVHDNETASLAVTLPPSATEGDVAVQGQVRVSAAVGSDVGVSLGSSDTSELTVPATVVIPAGQTSAVFTAAVINDGQIDGPEPVIVTAHVEGWTDGTAPITVLDDETVNLTLVVPAAASEGSGVLTNAGRMGIGGTLGTDLIVSLSSGDTSELVVPASVTIAAGATNATFNVTIVDDAATDGAVAVTVSASAGGFNGASAQTTVRDNDLHHFGWAAISSPKDAGIPFGVVLSALDVNSATIGVWSGTATLGGAGDGGAVTISPASTTVFTNGVWSGSLRVNAPDTNVRLTASDGAGHTGQSNPFDVQVAPLDHFVWSPIGATQFVGAPFAVNIAAQDAASNIVTSFTGTVALATCSDTKRGIGTGTNRWNYPLSTFYHDARTQVIYLRDELGGPTRLRSLGLDVATVPGQTMTNFTIRLKHTGVTNYSYLSRAWETDNWTVVYRASQTISTTGWVDIPFSTNFEYNGVSNLLVDISFNNSGYTTDGYCRYTPTATSRSIYYRTDSGCGDPLNWVGTSNPAPYLLAGIPNVRLSAGEGGGVPIVPTNSGNFAGGVWSGTIAVLEAGTNIAVVAADSVGHSGTSTVFTVEGFSDLAVVMGDAPDPVMAGSNLTYSVTITNGGPDSASLVVLTDPLSANFTFISASASQGTCTQVAGIVTCGLGTISNGAGATATIVVIPKISGTLTNSVTVSAAGTDPNPTNNTATVATAVEGVGILAVTPPEGLSFAGPLGGPFTPSNQVYLLSNIGAATLNWSAAHGANWVSLSAQSGMLVPSATAAVTVSVNSAAATLPVGEHADSITFSNLTGIGGGFVRDVNLTVNTPAPVLYGFPLDVDPGWTRQGEWAFGRPTGQGGAGFGGPDPSSGATGSNVFGVNLKGDYSTSVGGPYYLTAGPINFVGVTSIQLQFRRWLNSDYQPFVSATLDVSTNGSAWTAIWSNASTAIEESDWNTVRYDLPAWVNNRSNVYVRWGYRIASGAFAYSGWNIDDIQFLGAPTNHLVVAVPAVAFEGDGVLAGQGSVMITPAPGTNLAVTLTSSDTGEALVPTSVMVPAGQTNIVFDITVVDDGELDGTQMANISASAAGYIDGSATVAVHDNEAASLAVTLPPNATEGDVAVQGRVRVSAAVGSDVGVSLGSSDTSELTVPATVVIPAGQTSAVFTAAVINDGQIDGPQPVIVTAHVEGWTDGTAPITVLDDETVNLTLALPVAASEGSGVLTNAGRVGIGGTLGGDLVVSLSSGDTTELAVPGSVTISAGLTNATFNVTIVDDAENDGAVSVTVNASAGGFNGASAQTTVRDNDLHHFGWAAISSPKDAGIPFGVVLSALDVNSATIGVWSGTATLGGAGDGGAVTISPASTTAFTNGVWSGSLRVNAPDTNVRLTASDGAGHTGQSNPFDVQVAPLDHFVWSPIGATQFVGAPFAVNIAAQDAASNIVTSFTGTVALAARSVAQRAIGTGTNKWNCPLSTYFHDTRTQVIYLRDELGGAMCLTSVGLDVATVPGQTMTNLTIRLKHTGLTNYISGAWETDNWTMVYRANRAISTTGWVDIPFSTNFEYNGVSNLLVDISFNNSGYTTDGYCRYTPTTASRSIYYRTDSGFGDPLNWVGTSNPTPYLFAGIPNVRFTTGGGGGVPIIPTNSGGFVNGIWTGTVTALEGGAAVVLVANDGTGHSGTGNVFTVTAASDLGVAVMAASDPVWVGSNLFYSVSVTNLGPGVATGVVVSNSLPGDVVFGSAFASQGSWVNVTGIVVWSLGTLSNDQFATLNMNVTPVAAGLVTNRATLSALEPDPLPSNNIAFTFTTVLCDTDGDGIDDAYEDANGLDRNDPTDGPLDPDGDGLSNLEEYWADTDPRDRASCFTIAAFNWINGEAVIRFHVSANRTYRVEYSSDLVNWIELPGSIISGTEGIAEIIDGNAAIQPMRFYRARVQR